MTAARCLHLAVRIKGAKRLKKKNKVRSFAGLTYRLTYTIRRSIHLTEIRVDVLVKYCLRWQERINSFAHRKAKDERGEQRAANCSSSAGGIYKSHEDNVHD